MNGHSCPLPRWPYSHRLGHGHEWPRSYSHSAHAHKPLLLVTPQQKLKCQQHLIEVPRPLIQRQDVFNSHKRRLTRSLLTCLLPHRIQQWKVRQLASTLTCCCRLRQQQSSLRWKLLSPHDHHHSSTTSKELISKEPMLCSISLNKINKVTQLQLKTFFFFLNVRVLCYVEVACLEYRPYM